MAGAGRVSEHETAHGGGEKDSAARLAPGKVVPLAPAVSALRNAGTGQRCPASSLLALQRCAGNAAIGRVLARQPSRMPDVRESRTFIITYGSGQLNPTTYGHNVGELFKRAATTKLREIKARLGGDAARHNFVFEYTPSEVELRKVLNARYPSPVAEVHIFSHGWYEGINLGGPVPPGGKRLPTESDEAAEERRMRPEDLRDYNVRFASDAIVVLYGCNIGNAKAAPEYRPMAQHVSDAFGVPVTASTTSTHFATDAEGTHQVPDRPGKMVEYTPSPDAARAAITRYKALLADARSTRSQLDDQRALVDRVLGYLPTLERTSATAELARLENARAMSAKRPRAEVLVRETEDWTGADEVYMLVTGPGGASRTAIKSLNDGQAFTFALPIAPFGDFTKPVTIDVYDDDWPDADDLIVRMSWTPPFRPLRNNQSYDGAQYEVTASFD